MFLACGRAACARELGLLKRPGFKQCSPLFAETHHSVNFAAVPAPQLTVIGLDAATFDVLDPLIGAGELPNLARLLADGTGGVLRSATHPLTPHAWSTIVTGVNAGRHGIWDFTERDESGYNLRLVNGSYRRAPALWDRLSAAGRRVGLVNVPFSWPAPEVNGFAIAGMDASFREQGMTAPAELLAELKGRFGALELDHSYPIGADGRIDLDFVRRAVEQKVAATLWLAERFEPELLFVVFMAADHVQHLGWTEWAQRGAESAVAGTYRILDEAVGALVDAAAGGDVLVLSDHGAGELRGVVNLNAWLASEGYLEYTSRGARLDRRLFDAAFELRRRIPKRFRYAVKQRASGLRERIYEREEYSVIDWPRTRAFAYGTFGNLVINVRGRERDGIVEPGDEYERLRDEVAAKALDLRSPSGEPIVAAVHRREDLFHGPYLGVVPDLLVEFAEYAWLGKGNLKRRGDTLWDRIEVEPGSEHTYVGSHRHEGIFALAGPSATAGERGFAGIADIAPTILYLLGMPIPGDLEGRIIAEAIDPSLLDGKPPEYVESGKLDLARTERSTYSESEAEEVEARLRGLGYLE
jgi:predicted AlkP superfamily phosphohydrolase/phosphomutase